MWPNEKTLSGTMEEGLLQRHTMTYETGMVCRAFLEQDNIGKPHPRVPARLERVWAQLMHIMAQLKGAAACLVTKTVLPEAIRIHDQRTSHLHT